MSVLEVVGDRRLLQLRADDWRRDGLRIVLCPTMGYLHAGHLSLLDEGRRRGDRLVLSLFVNPTQFGPKEDLARYPRDLDGDLEKARAHGVDVAFVPDAASMYLAGYQTWIEVRELSRGLCGERRPGHFAGVASVVAKLFHIAKPHVAIFGEKDYQQLAVIRRMVRDLDLDVEIVGMPIVREADGLAMSSRNAYLAPGEREQAVVLVKSLARAEAAVEDGERRGGVIIDAVREVIGTAPLARVDYVELRDAESLSPIDEVRRPAVLALAVFFGATRLIDNRVLARRS